ncbi:MAG: 4'-phosphopantetheinyl transferase superfamily protein [Lachnospiraceae bacterium]|nr:4'-phosphopantetheinyl transferase superfamily protein [Lachnospiraceae bacterium]
MIQVWITETELFHKEENFQRGLAWTDAARLEKIHACRVTEDKVRSLCCGLLLQYALRMTEKAETGKGQGESVCAAGKRELRYGYGSHGKPYLPDYPRYHFNLSHSGAYAAIAFGDHEVGVDIQKRRPVREALARRVLSKAEYAYYMTLADMREREDWFFRCWCRMESRGKLTGEGLAPHLEEETPAWETIGGTPGREAQSVEKCGGVVFKDYQPAPDYYMSVCAANPRSGMAGVLSEAPLFPTKAANVTQALLQMISGRLSQNES